MVLAIAAELDLDLNQIDFDTAFLNADVDAYIYVAQPEGYSDGTNRVCKLHKALYGLKQAPYVWNTTINATMLRLGYKRCDIDPCIYLKHGTISGTGETVLIIAALYVDDTVIAYNKAGAIIWSNDKVQIGKEYVIKDLGDCKWVLNMEVKRDRSNGTITLSQYAYITKMLEDLEMDKTNPVKTPGVTTPGPVWKVVNGKPVIEREEESKPILPVPVPVDGKEHEWFRTVIGKLSYAAVTTRVDIAYNVNALARYLAAPCEHHIVAAKRILRYLCGTKRYCLVLGKGTAGAHPISVFTDASWASNRDDRRSTTGTLVLHNGHPVYWNSRLQKSTAGSTAEAEYVALADAVKEAQWLRAWLREVLNKGNNNIPVQVTSFEDKVSDNTGSNTSFVTSDNDAMKDVPSVHCDNQAAIAIAKKGLASAPTTKHIAIKYHIVQELVASKLIDLQWVPTKQQLADLLTKSLGEQQLVPVLKTLMCTTDGDNIGTVNNNSTRKVKVKLGNSNSTSTGANDSHSIHLTITLTGNNNAKRSLILQRANENDSDTMKDITSD